jgi:two-component system cell cycle response regulator DivK
MQQILVIEDSADNIRVIRKLLEHAGYKAIIAHNGETGLQLAFTQSPDLILVDLGLPDIDGQTVITILRQQPELNKVPIVAFTGWPENYAVNMAQQYGCDGVIVKPIGIRDFVKQIEYFLQSASV